MVQVKLSQHVTGKIGPIKFHTGLYLNRIDLLIGPDQEFR